MAEEEKVKPSAAVQATVVRYHSDLLPLPPTVDGLIKEMEQLYQRHVTLRGEVEKLHTSPAVGAPKGPAVGGGAAVTDKKDGEGRVVKGKVVVVAQNSGEEKKDATLSGTVTPPLPPSLSTDVVTATTASAKVETVPPTAAGKALVEDLKAELAAAKAKLASSSPSVTVDVAALANECVLYEKQQLQTRVEELQKSVNFLKEKNSALEGQLQRLFSADVGSPPSMEVTPAKATPPEASEVTDAHEVFRRELETLTAQKEKYKQQYRKENQRRQKLEELNTTMNKEIAELKSSLLELKREANDKELDITREASEMEDLERYRNLEKEFIKLRNTLRERSEEYDTKYAEMDDVIQQQNLQLKVYAKAVPHLQKSLVDLQVKEVVFHQIGKRVPERGTGSAVKESPNPSPNNNTYTETVNTTGSPSATTEAVPTSSSEEVATSHSLEREKMLEELKLIYERRVESLEAKKKAEMKQIITLNKELKQALSSCQEELQQMTQLLKQAQRNSKLSLLSESISPSRTGAFVSGRNSPEPTSLASTHNASTNPVSDLNNNNNNPRMMSPSMSMTLTEIESRYDPENMSLVETIQLENEALLQRLTILQEEKWSMSGHIADLQQRCASQKEELQIQSNMLNHIIEIKNKTAPGQVVREEDKLKFLQTLLQETLEKNIALEGENQNLKIKLARHS